MVIHNYAYMVPCYIDTHHFFLWMITNPSGERFHISAFVQKNNDIINGQRNPNMITSYSKRSPGFFGDRTRAYIFLSSIRYRTKIQLFVFDITNVGDHSVKYIHTKTYNSTYFLKRGQKVEPFNLRGIINYEKFYPEHVEITNPFYINLVVSCINNGLVFIQFKEDFGNDTYTPPKDLKYQLDITSNTHFNGIGRLFTEKSFRNTDVDFNFFATSQAPPIVYQWNIDSNRNVKTYRTLGYDAFNLTVQRYIGFDEVSVNGNYIAHLLFDTHNFHQVVRIYYRNETNFGSGHTHIKLYEFKTFVSAFTFLRYED